MSLVRYDKAHKRLWILNARVHHGAVGFALFVLGLWLMIDDWRDLPWISDLTD